MCAMNASLSVYFQGILSQIFRPQMGRSVPRLTRHSDCDVLPTFLRPVGDPKCLICRQLTCSADMWELPAHGSAFGLFSTEPVLHFRFVPIPSRLEGIRAM